MEKNGTLPVSGMWADSERGKEMKFTTIIDDLIITKPEYERTLTNLNQFLQQKAKEVTADRVSLRVSKRIPVESDNGTIRIIRYAPKTVKQRPQWEIIFSYWYFIDNADNLPKLKKLIAHELAHIRMGGNHDLLYQKYARKLGAGKYCDTGEG
jgi:hypothetical protein